MVGNPSTQRLRHKDCCEFETSLGNIGTGQPGLQPGLSKKKKKGKEERRGEKIEGLKEGTGEGGKKERCGEIGSGHQGASTEWGQRIPIPSTNADCGALY